MQRQFTAPIRCLRPGKRATSSAIDRAKTYIFISCSHTHTPGLNMTQCHVIKQYNRRVRYYYSVTPQIIQNFSLPSLDLPVCFLAWLIFFDRFFWYQYFPSLYIFWQLFTFNPKSFTQISVLSISYIFKPDSLL